MDYREKINTDALDAKRSFSSTFGELKTMINTHDLKLITLDNKLREILDNTRELDTACANFTVRILELEKDNDMHKRTTSKKYDTKKSFDIIKSEMKTFGNSILNIRNVLHQTDVYIDRYLPVINL